MVLSYYLIASAVFVCTCAQTSPHQTALLDSVMDPTGASPLAAPFNTSRSPTSTSAALGSTSNTPASGASGASAPASSTSLGSFTGAPSGQVGTTNFGTGLGNVNGTTPGAGIGAATGNGSGTGFGAALGIGSGTGSGLGSGTGSATGFGSSTGSGSGTGNVLGSGAGTLSTGSGNGFTGTGANSAGGGGLNNLGFSNGGRSARNLSSTLSDDKGLNSYSAHNVTRALGTAEMAYANPQSGYKSGGDSTLQFSRFRWSCYFASALAGGLALFA